MHLYVYVLLSFIGYSSVKSLTFITENVIDDGQWTFQEGSTVTLVCTNNPYTGINTFTFNSIRVLSCTGSVCVPNDGYQKEFSFIHDTDSGIFTWIINNVNMTYNDKVFECDDGYIHIRRTVAVNMAKGDPSENRQKVAIAIACTLCSLCVLIICIRYLYIRQVCDKRKETYSYCHRSEGKYQRRRGKADKHSPEKFSLSLAWAHADKKRFCKTFS